MAPTAGAVASPVGVGAVVAVSCGRVLAVGEAGAVDGTAVDVGSGVLVDVVAFGSCVSVTVGVRWLLGGRH